METAFQNIRQAIRQLRRYPAFAFVAVITLAVGIGANAAIFSLVEQILLRQLPVTDPDKLVMLQYAGSDTGHSSSYGGDDHQYFSYPMYRELRDHNSVFTGMLAMFPAQVGVQWKNASTLANSELVTGNYFTVLGVKPALGRLFLDEDSKARGSSPIVVLSYNYWKNRFASEPLVINQSILVNGSPLTIIGVVQPGFDSAISGTRPDFFVPMTMKAQMTPLWDELEDPRSKWLNIVARLKPGLSVKNAEAGINPLWKALRARELEDIPTKSQQFRDRFVAKSYLTLLNGSKGFSPLRESLRIPLLILTGMVFLLTLMAIANVGSLLLVRAAGRVREMSVRYSLGATRVRVLGQLLVEGLVLGLTGGLCGLAVSPLLTKALIYLIDPASNGSGTTSLTTAPNPRLLAFCFALSVVASLLFSLAPIIQFYRPHITPALRQQMGTGELSDSRFRRFAVSAQIALSLLLLFGAGLFSRTLRNLKTVDVGFVPEHLVTFQLDPHLAGYQANTIGSLYKRLIESLSAQPEAQSVGMTDDPVLANSDSTFSIEVPGYQAQEGERMSIEWEHVTPEYFSTLRIPLVAGRALKDSDVPTSLKVAVVNENFVHKFFASDLDAIGRTFSVGKKNQPLQIVGVVGNAKHRSLHENNAPIFYSPIFQDLEPGSVAVYVRSRTADDSAARAIRSAVSGVDSKLVVDSLQSMNAEIDTTLSSERILAFLAASFGVVAVFISGIGIYGVLAYTIAQRTREIGVRMALGASRRAVVGMVLREVMTMTGWSIAVAVPLSLALGSFVKSQLFGVSYRDPVTLALAIVAIAFVALLSACIPAGRAVRVQPVTALRYE
jgi:putative ABC transport system permease protein